MKAPSRTAARERVLSDAELIAIWFAAEKMGFPFSYYIKLLILLGQRRNEGSSLCWGDLDFQKRVWNQPSSNKSQRPIIVPLSDLALATIRAVPRVHDKLVFPGRGKETPISGYSKWKRRIDLLSGVSGWTLNDLRRTAATRMAAMKVPIHIVELILNHRAKSLSGVMASIIGIFI
jgi:integrase